MAEIPPDVLLREISERGKRVQEAVIWLHQQQALQKRNTNTNPASGEAVSYESACENGYLSIVQSIISEKAETPDFLNQGPIIALGPGQVEVARLLISAGAFITQGTPKYIYQVPTEEHFALYELLFEQGWTPILRETTASSHLRTSSTTTPSRTDWCQALENAASEGDIVAVRMLLDAGALIKNGAPLHRAAGACTLGKSLHADEVVPTKKFDTSMIPIMDLLIERWADVNQPENSRNMTFRYAFNYAVAASAVERVRRLLEHGVNPENVGMGVNAISLSKMWKREEMMKVVKEGVAARRWVKDAPKTETEPKPKPTDR